MVDRLEELWKTFAPEDRPHTLVINADNGPENSSRRTQWMKRLTEFSDTHQIRIRLAYYPPYHSKYNPVERLWGVLENHWRGELLDSVVGLARSMAYSSINLLPLFKNGMIFTFMALIGRHEVNRTMTMLLVIPLHKFMYPFSC